MVQREWLNSGSVARNRRLRTLYLADKKTRPTDASIEDSIASKANARQLTDCRECR